MTTRLFGTLEYSLYVLYPRPPLLQCVSKSTDPCYLNDRSIPTLILLIFFAKVLSFVIFFFLFFRNRGAHNFWLSGKVLESPSSPNGLINLIHYDDAAQVEMDRVLIHFRSMQLPVAANTSSITALARERELL